MRPKETPHGLAPARRLTEEIGKPIMLVAVVAPPRRLDADLAVQHHVENGQVRRLVYDMQRKQQQRRRRI